MSEFSRRIAGELDFREEARHAATLRRNFAGVPSVVVPEVVSELTRHRVLVLEYMEGTRIDRLHERLACGELRLDALMTILVELYLKMMLEDGVFHADPHAGNLLVDPAGRIVLLDFGMVLEVERETRRRLVQTVLAAARQDVDGVINGFYELGHPGSRRGSRHGARRGAEPHGHRRPGRRLASADPAPGRAGAPHLLRVAADAAVQPGLLRARGGAGGRHRPALRPGVQRDRDRPSGAGPLGGPAGAGGAAGGSARPASPTGPRRRSPRSAPCASWSAGSSATSFGSAGTRATRSSCSAFWPSRCAGRCSPSSPSPSRSSPACSISPPGDSPSWCPGSLIAFGMFLVIFLLPAHLFQNPLRFRRRWPAP